MAVLADAIIAALRDTKAAFAQPRRGRRRDGGAGPGVELPACGRRPDAPARQRLQRQRELPLELLVDARGAWLGRAFLLDVLPVRAVRHRPDAPYAHGVERVRRRDSVRRAVAARRVEHHDPAVAVPQRLLRVPAGVADHERYGCLADRGAGVRRVAISRGSPEWPL